MQNFIFRSRDAQVLARVAHADDEEGEPDETIVFKAPPSTEEDPPITGQEIVTIRDELEELEITAAPDKTAEGSVEPGAFLIEPTLEGARLRTDIFYLLVDATGSDAAHSPVADENWPATAEDPIDYALSNDWEHPVLLEVISGQPRTDQT